MKHPNEQHRWQFSVTLWDEEMVYLNADGQSVDESDAEAFICNDFEAAIECERRAVIYEEAHEDGWVSEPTRHELGLVDQTLYTKPDEAVKVC